MPPALRSAFDALQAYSDGLAPWVSVWMTVMTVILNLSLVFVVWRVEARWVLAMAFLTPVFAVLFVLVLGPYYVGGFAQVVLWTPVAAYLIIRRRSLIPPFGDPPSARIPSGSGEPGLIGRIIGSRSFDAAYRLWLTAVLAIILVSLSFDWPNVVRRLLASP